MNILHSTKNKDQFKAPNFSRVRHRFRGSRESQKINLEVSQLYFSIKNLFFAQETLKEKYLDYVDKAVNGFESDILDMDGNIVKVPGQNQIEEELDGLLKRVKALEDK